MEINELVREMVQDERKTYKDVSNALKEMFPDVDRGLSVRSIRRLCKNRQIHSSSLLDDSQVEALVLQCVKLVRQGCNSNQR